MAAIGDAKRFRVDLTEGFEQSFELGGLRFGSRVVRLDGMADDFAGGDSERSGLAVAITSSAIRPASRPMRAESSRTEA